MNTNTLQFGSSGQLVVLLQQFLNTKGYFISMDGQFGDKTKQALLSFQTNNKLSPTGVATQELIEMVSRVTILDTWCLAIKAREGYIAPCAKYPTGTSSWRNNNPGNIRSGNGFMKYPTYQDGYNALKTLLIRACTGQSKVYNPNGTLYQFYAGIPPFNQFPGYAPVSDGNDPVDYSKEVASKMRVKVDVIIKTLLN